MEKSVFTGMLIAIALLSRASAQGIISSDTIGQNVDIFSVDGIHLTTLFLPVFTQATASDAAGNLYIAGHNGGDYTITKITPAGTSSVFASGASLGNAEGLAFDNLGNLYVATHLGGTIVKITSDGTQSVFAGGAFADDYSGLSFSAADGNLYATAGLEVYQFTLGGTRTLVAEIPGSHAIATDSLGLLYVIGNDRNIYRVTPQGVVTPFALDAQSLAITVDNNGNVYSSNFLTGDLEKFDPVGVKTLFFPNVGTTRYLSFGPTIVPEPGTIGLVSVAVALFGAGRCAVRGRIRSRRRCSQSTCRS